MRFVYLQVCEHNMFFYETVRNRSANLLAKAFQFKALKNAYAHVTLILFKLLIHQHCTHIFRGALKKCIKIQNNSSNIF